MSYNIIKCNLCSYTWCVSRDVVVFTTPIGKGSKELYCHHQCFKRFSGITFTEFKNKYERISTPSDPLATWVTRDAWHEFSGL